MESPDDFDIVLCRAAESGNIGFICRAMKTMGFKNLVFAACEPFDDQAVRTFSVHAYDVFERALHFDTLEEALSPYGLVAGFTRRRGKRRKAWSQAVDEFAASAWNRPGGRIALVFGNEMHGLSHEELELCDLAVHIPSSDDFPSLNISHAVQIACWELARVRPARMPSGYSPVTRESVENVSRRVADRMAELGCFRLVGRPEAEAFIRSILSRAATSVSELRYFEGLAFRSLALSAGISPSIKPVRKPENSGESRENAQELPLGNELDPGPERG